MQQALIGQPIYIKWPIKNPSSLISDISLRNVSLTYSYLQIFFKTSVVWTCQTFKNNFEIKHKFGKYLMEHCDYSSDEQFSFKYFLNITYVREISPKLPGCSYMRVRH